MKILGLSPLDKDSTASLVEDGRVLFAAGEERFNRVKQTSGFPWNAVQAALESTGTAPEEIDVVAYPFLTAEQETAKIETCLREDSAFRDGFEDVDWVARIDAAQGRVPMRRAPIHGLLSPNETMDKGWAKELFDGLAGAHPQAAREFARQAASDWARRASRDHQRFQEELEDALARYGWTHKLKRGEHHLSHAANAYLASGFDDALVVTLDGYGTGLAGSISRGRGGRLERLHGLRFPSSLGTFYEAVTSSLGFHPDRHAGKIVGLAAYGDPAVLTDVLLERVERRPGDFHMLDNLSVWFSRYVSTRLPKVDVAAGYQRALEVLACEYVAHWVRQTGCRAVVLSGGVAANVKMNQRIHEIDGVEQTFVYPNMGDGGCGTGLGLLWSWPAGRRETIRDVYWGPAYSPEDLQAELERFGLRFERPRDLASEIARRIHAGEVVGRFDGRMEYGPRALGNRSILYHAREPEVNHWLNVRLGRTEFMPFAPVTLWEARERCYEHVAGAEHAAEFMTITFDCTPWMRESCPAAVHVDGTARPQLLRREVNPDYYAIVEAYERLSGIPCLINTSFNMHEEPIVCTPRDALRAFLDGRLDGLALGPFYVPNPTRSTAPQGEPRHERAPVAAHA